MTATPRTRRSAPETPKTGRGATKQPRKPVGAESELEAILENRLERAGLPLGETQVPVIPNRRWRFDRAWREQMVAVEVQGGIWSGGRHARGSGIAKECEKFSTAAAIGWRILPVTRDMIEDGRAVALIRQALGEEARTP